LILDEYVIKKEDLLTKCGWSPFAGQTVNGKVKRVYIRGELVFQEGKVLVAPGTGHVLGDEL